MGDISIAVIHKDIKNVHLSVHPPKGRVTISAPLKMNLETIRLFSISKLGWIRRQQAKLKNQKREPAREYIPRESHYYLGKRYLLKLIEHDAPPKVVLKHSTIELYHRKEHETEHRHEILHSWYRQQLRALVQKYIETLEKKMDVKVTDVGIRTMKTKWGTCNAKAKRIWLNTELAKKPLEHIEYVLTHEMVHLLERNHNDRFIAYMDKLMPNWRHNREELNRAALGYMEWGGIKNRKF